MYNTKQKKKLNKNKKKKPKLSYGNHFLFFYSENCQKGIVKTYKYIFKHVEYFFHFTYVKILDGNKIIA